MPKQPRARAALIVTVATICGAASSVADAQQPDFTGVWEAYRAPQAGASGGRGARPSLPLTEEGRRRVEEYGVLAGPTRLNGATFCADYGVPTMMSMPGRTRLSSFKSPISSRSFLRSTTRRGASTSATASSNPNGGSRAVPDTPRGAGTATRSSSRPPISRTAWTSPRIRTPSRPRSTSASRSTRSTARRS